MTHIAAEEIGGAIVNGMPALAVNGNHLIQVLQTCQRYFLSGNYKIM